MNKFSSISILIFVILLGLVGIEFLASKVISTDSFNNKIHLSNDVIKFYESHYGDLHHLRGLDDTKWKLNKNPENALYNAIAPFNDSQDNILIQGDSWAAQFETKLSRKTLLNFATENQVGIINAGASSYAPSVMTIQLRKLRQKFNIHPNHIVAIIDQTDIGDELCRYAIRRQISNSGQLIRVSPEPFESNETYKLKLFFQKQTILRSDKFALQKLVESVSLKVRHNLSKEKRRCRWREISRPLLRGITKEEEQDFISAINRYVDEVFLSSHVKSLHIVAHPHRNHFSNEPKNRYVLYNGTLIRSALATSKHRAKVILLDFLKRDFGLFLLNPITEPFREGDSSSHLKDEIHGTELTPRILEHLAKQL